jgi:hypothetical protein
MLDMRELDPRQLRLCHRVTLVKIIDIVALAHRPRRFDEIIRQALERCQLVGQQRIPDQQVTVFPVG